MDAKKKLIRLAYETPELRDVLLPIIKKIGDWEPGGIEVERGWDPGEVVTEAPKTEQKDNINPLTDLKDPGEGSQAPPARDIDGKGLPMPELTVGVK